MNANKIALIIMGFILISLIVYFELTESRKDDNKPVFHIDQNSSAVVIIPSTDTASAALTTSTVKTTTHISKVKTTSIKTTKTTAKITKSVTQTTAVTTASPDVPLYIDINTADCNELMKLYGIGQARAQDIINYRNAHGGFKNIEEIMNVDGIGEKIFLKIHDSIYVKNPVYVTTFKNTSTTTKIAATTVTTADVTSILTSAVITETSLPPPTESISAVTETTTEEITVSPLEEAAPININTADIETLCLLPHVDEKIAEKIIELKNKINVFSHPYELLYVEELTRKQVAEIIEYVTVTDSMPETEDAYDEE